MNKPAVYVNFNTLQKNDATYTLDNYIKYLKWNPNKTEKVLEIGCGPGDVTKDILVPALPGNVEELVCLDRSEEMINFAKNNSKHDKIKYMQMDISNDDLTNVLGKNTFDHVFSFYCLNWVQDQRKAYKNIYDVLKPGGDALVLLNAYHPVFEVYHWLAQQEKYHLYHKETDNFVSPYFTKKHPKQDLEDILTDLGFIIHACEYKPLDFVFPNESYIKGKQTKLLFPKINRQDNEIIFLLLTNHNLHFINSLLSINQ
ncbi:juvenile hormone acid O-methyltransferase-like [Agrilus planipennis]|uniref:Juvenile hormone acid O-methyltransferase-like n=1 Tax=Agrilus planipennis TaxID=224129 RepID=A0A7F5R3U0_AGRPL|nr:juvenile hormone acid O-methyltransferase-like [Agrilus planipennis]